MCMYMNQCVYAVYFDHFNSYPVFSPNLEQMFLDNYSPKFGTNLLRTKLPVDDALLQPKTR